MDKHSFTKCDFYLEERNKEYLFWRFVTWLIFEVLLGCLVTPVAPSQATAVARNILTDTVKHWNKPCRDVLVVEVLAVHRKWACTKPICFAFHPFPVHIACPSIGAGAEISSHIWCKSSHFPCTGLPWSCFFRFFTQEIKVMTGSLTPCTCKLNLKLRVTPRALASFSRTWISRHFFSRCPDKKHKCPKDILCLDDRWRPCRNFTLKFATKLLLKVEMLALSKFLKIPPIPWFCVVVPSLPWRAPSTCAVVIQLCPGHSSAKIQRISNQPAVFRCTLCM